jgi:hypothetical protein
MTPDEHRERHKLLHRYLDELLADFVRHSNGPVLGRTIEELMNWSFRQTETPDEEIVNGLRDGGE